MGFIVCGDKESVLPILGKLRNLLAKEMIPDLEERPDKFLWVVDFPLFLMEDGVLESAPHPFTACHPEDLDMFRSRPIECRSLHYDLVLNGQEVGGGSVRIHSMEDQMFVLDDVLKADVSELSEVAKIRSLSSRGPFRLESASAVCCWLTSSPCVPPLWYIGLVGATIRS